MCTSILKSINLMTKTIEYQCNKESKKTDYKQHVNLSKHKNDDLVYLTFIYSDYNHELLADNARFAMKF